MTFFPLEQLRCKAGATPLSSLPLQTTATGIKLDKTENPNKEGPLPMALAKQVLNPQQVPAQAPSHLQQKRLEAVKVDDSEG